ncbi:MAG TPA: polysaccharide biosynthesis/export family protein, partial [Chthonomonadales bacterium]|nr:polysaccharide biosynthesis/export family protein [Chthonomonadales bacterium]
MKSHLIGYIAAAALLAICCVSWAQSPPPAKATAPAAAAAPASNSPGAYKLEQDDVISVTIVNHPELSLSQVTIPPDGTLGLQVLKPFSVMGMTTTELEETLTKKWSVYLKNPAVAVTLVKRRTDYVFVYGEVLHPGTTDYKDNQHILECIAEAGGPVADLAELSKVTVTRKSGQAVTLDLSHPDQKGGTPADIVMQAGDVIYVPMRHTEVAAVGEGLGAPGS